MLAWLRLSQGANLHMVPLMPLPLIISCSSKSRFILPSWFYLSGAGSPGQSSTKSKRAIKWLCVCVSLSLSLHLAYCKLIRMMHCKLGSKCVCVCTLCTLKDNCIQTGTSFINNMQQSHYRNVKHYYYCYTITHVAKILWCQYKHATSLQQNITDVHYLNLNPYNHVIHTQLKNKLNITLCNI